MWRFNPSHGRVYLSRFTGSVRYHTQLFIENEELSTAQNTPRLWSRRPAVFHAGGLRWTHAGGGASLHSVCRWIEDPSEPGVGARSVGQPAVRRGGRHCSLQRRLRNCTICLAKDVDRRIRRAGEGSVERGRKGGWGEWQIAANARKSGNPWQDQSPRRQRAAMAGCILHTVCPGRVQQLSAQEVVQAPCGSRLFVKGIIQNECRNGCRGRVDGDLVQVDIFIPRNVLDCT